MWLGDGTWTDERLKRQTIIGNFYQLDKLVVEGGISVGSSPRLRCLRTQPERGIRNMRNGICR